MFLRLIKKLRSVWPTKETLASLTQSCNASCTRYHCIRCARLRKIRKLSGAVRSACWVRSSAIFKSCGATKRRQSKRCLSTWWRLCRSISPESKRMRKSSRLACWTTVLSRALITRIRCSGTWSRISTRHRYSSCLGSNRGRRSCAKTAATSRTLSRSNATWLWIYRNYRADRRRPSLTA